MSSKKLSYLLRHELNEVGPDGYVDLSVVEQAMNVNRDVILKIVQEDTKQLYEVRGNRIRARPGATIEASPE